MRKDEMNNSEKYTEIVPVHLRQELARLIESNLSFRERWEVAKARAEAVGNARMVIADFLIEEGLMKRVLGKKRG
jgi:hypothetical protein